MKIRMREDVGGSMAVKDGTAWNVKRGDIIEAPNDEIGEQYIATGLATAQLSGDLPVGNVQTKEQLALRDKVARRIAAATPEEHRPVRGPINVKRGGQLV